jgi:lysozyme family protein
VTMADLKLALIEPILEREGGWVDRADDPGGPTNFGVTLNTFRHYMRNDNLVTADLRKIDRATAREILWQSFVIEPRIDTIPNEAVRAVVADAAVNQGPVPAVKMLQQSLGGLVADGILGTHTLGSIPAGEAGVRAALRFLVRRLEVLVNAARTSKLDADHDGIPDKLEKLPGWTNRCLEQMRLYA